MPPKLSIIIPAKNEEKYIGSCLDALLLAATAWSREHETILVDNGSTDSTREIARSRGCIVIDEPVSTIGGLRNRGALVADGDLLAFLDADCIVDPNWILYCLQAFENERIAVVGTRAVPAVDESTWVERSWYRLMSGAPRSDFVDWIGTSNMFVRREAFLEVGGFDESLEVAEDVNLCYQIGKRGRLVYLEKRIDTIHLRESKTLAELFMRESRRGRSSLQSFFNNKMHLRELPSILLPTLNIGFVLSVLVLLMLYPGYSAVPILAILLLPLSILVKKRPKGCGLRELIQCFTVALAYVFGRSAALLSEIRTVAGRVFFVSR